MATAPMDALTSFVYLSDHLPKWISEINTLGALVLTKREEFMAEYRRVLEHARPKRKKTLSATSVKTDDKPPSIGSQKNETNARDILSLARPAGISPLDPENKYLFANTRRGKRRQGTSIRSGASGLQTFRTQHQVIIYYDSTLQAGFEGLVKGIGIARNNLRKGKQTRALERGLRLPSFGLGNNGRMQRNSMLLPSVPKPSISPDISIEPKLLLDDFSAADDDDAYFAKVSKDLEAAQALCETAAHQFLRDGDCTLEIDQIRQYFENVSQIAKAQIESWEIEKNGSGMEIKSTRSAVRQEDHDMATAIATKLGAYMSHATNTEGAEMEVDSDDETAEDEMVIDISTFRSARKHGLRA